MNINAKHDLVYDKVVEKAITYLVQAFVSTGRNPKPVILHSIRAGIYLYNQNTGKDIVIAALLHDLLEDTDITMEDIEKEFGLEVAKLVAANTFNRSIIDKNECDMEMINRCKKGGKGALIIKAVDILDNSQFYYLSKNEEQYNRLLRKMKYFLEISSEELENEPIWHLLEQQYNQLVRS
jgi:(p)ppGpp synthase/HD superfamily hydrolase